MGDREVFVSNGLGFVPPLVHSPVNPINMKRAKSLRVATA